MKRGGELKRTPMKASSKPLARSSTLKTSKPMQRSDKPLARATAPMRARSKTNSDPRPKTGEAELCRGQQCYLLVPGVLAHPVDTVVPCHSNAERHGKGMGMKAHDRYTVPGCLYCHSEIDQGMRFTREEKFALWDDAFARWKPVRETLSIPF